MTDEPLRPRLGNLTSAALEDLAEECCWQCLAAEVDARATLQAVHQELADRGTVSVFHRTILRVATTVIGARRRIEQSPEFRSSPLLQGLLRRLVRHTLLTGEAMKQAALAVEVYGPAVAGRKGAGAVSTEISRLRDTLKSHYEGSGLGASIRMQIPKGRGRHVVIIRRVVFAEIDGHVAAVPSRCRPGIQVVPLNGLRGISVYPTFSPTGEDIAFSWNQDRGGYRLNLFVQPVSSTSPRQITSSALTADISPAWSPDGTFLAFVRVSLGRSQVVVAAPASQMIHERTIAEVFATRQEILGRHLAWVPDGTALAVVDKTAGDQPYAIVRLALATGSKEPLTHPPSGIIGDSDPAFAPDGRALAFVRSTAVGVKDVYVLPRGARDPIRLTSDNKNIYGLCWLPNSRSLVFSSSRAGVPGLWRVGLGGELPERLPGVGDRALHPACSIKGRCLAYTNLVVSTSLWELPLADPAPSPPHARLFITSTRNDVNPDISPDGTRVVFASDRSGTFEIWIADSAGVNVTKVTDFGSPSGAGSPRWSPDGSRIVFDSRADGHARVYVLSLETGKAEPLTQGLSENVVPSWSRDGRHVYFSSNRSGQQEVWRVPSEGGDASQVTRSGGFGPVQSPDGKYVYYAKGRSSAGLWRIDLETAREESVLETLKPTFWGLWALTAEGVYYLDTPPDGPPPCTLYFLDLATRESTPRTVLDGIKRVHYQGLAIAPDGKRLLYPQLNESAGEILLARNAF